MSVFLVLYSSEGWTAYQGLDLDTIAVTSTRTRAEAEMQTHAEQHQHRGEWYVEGYT